MSITENDIKAAFLWLKPDELSFLTSIVTMVGENCIDAISEAFVSIPSAPPLHLPPAPVPPVPLPAPLPAPLPPPPELGLDEKLVLLCMDLVERVIIQRLLHVYPATRITSHYLFLRPPHVNPYVEMRITGPNPMTDPNSSTLFKKEINQLVENKILELVRHSFGGLTEYAITSNISILVRYLQCALDPFFLSSGDALREDLLSGQTLPQPQSALAVALAQLQVEQRLAGDINCDQPERRKVGGDVGLGQPGQAPLPSNTSREKRRGEQRFMGGKRIHRESAPFVSAFDKFTPEQFASLRAIAKGQWVGHELLYEKIQATQPVPDEYKKILVKPTTLMFLEKFLSSNGLNAELSRQVVSDRTQINPPPPPPPLFSPSP